jgi:sugar phosphate isomerase/epimerase
MPSPISVQLYSVRDALGQDFVGTIRRIAEIGFVGVETAGMFGESLESAAALFRDLGLTVSGMHTSMPLGDDKQKVLDTAAALGAKTLVMPWIQPELFTTLDGVKSVAEKLTAAEEVARQHGLRIGYHNHDFEFRPLPDGSIPHVHLRNLTPASVIFELDVYWIKTAGQDPVATVRELGSRAPLLHMKDGPAVPDKAMTALGDGVVDVVGVAQAGSAAEWLVVELDRCDTDMMTAIERSYDYLVSKGLADGTQG